MREHHIGKPEMEYDEKGNLKRVYVQFGPHYFVDIMPNDTGELTLYLGATHHGFHARAVDVGGELERIIYEVREKHPDLSFD